MINCNIISYSTSNWEYYSISKNFEYKTQNLTYNISDYSEHTSILLLDNQHLYQELYELK